MEARTCPGCHFGCDIEDYQCARGEKLHARWVETGELPERRGPGHGPGANPASGPKHSPEHGGENGDREHARHGGPDGSGGPGHGGHAGESGGSGNASSAGGPGGPRHGGPGRGVMPVGDRLMHMLHIIEIALNDLTEESGAGEPVRRAVDCLMRHEGAASKRIIEGRTHLAELDAALESAQAQGLVAQRTHGETALYELTDTGLEQARTWEAERKAAEAEFLSALAEDEQEQLLELIMKLLKPGFRRRMQR